MSREWSAFGWVLPVMDLVHQWTHQRNIVQRIRHSVNIDKSDKTISSDLVRILIYFSLFLINLQSITGHGYHSNFSIIHLSHMSLTSYHRYSSPHVSIHFISICTTNRVTLVYSTSMSNKLGKAPGTSPSRGQRNQYLRIASSSGGIGSHGAYLDVRMVWMGDRGRAVIRSSSKDIRGRVSLPWILQVLGILWVVYVHKLNRELCRIDYLCLSQWLATV